MTGLESYHVGGVKQALENGGSTVRVRAEAADGTAKEFTAKLRIDTPQEVEYYRNGGILPFVLRQLAAK